MAVFSSPGYGKSTFLQTVVMDLARQHNPEHLHLYLLDFGTNGLLPLKNLPHIADTIMIDEVEKINRLVHRMDDEIKKRKKMLSEYRVATIDQYEKAGGIEVPNILLVLDNYDSIRDSDFNDEFERTLTQITREGASVGIYLILSASRYNAMRIQMSANIKTLISLFIIDQTETRLIVGRTELKIEELSGRALVDQDGVTLVQTTLPAKGMDSIELIGNLQREGMSMTESWNGDLPEPIPVMPEVINMKDYIERKQVKEAIRNHSLPLGLEYEDILTCAHDFAKNEHLIIYSDDYSALSEIKLSVLEQILCLKNKKNQIHVVDSDFSYINYKENIDNYITDSEVGMEYVLQWVKEIRKRDDLLLRARKTAQTENPLKNLKNHIIFIPNANEFSDLVNLQEQDAQTLIEKGKDVGIYLVISSLQSEFLYPDNELTSACRSRMKAAVIGMKMGDQSYFPSSYISGEKKLLPDQAYYYVRGNYEKIQMPKIQ